MRNTYDGLSPVDFPPGTIGIISGDLARWAVFSQALLATQFPPGSHVVWASGQWIAGAVNEIIAQMRPESAWVSILADDHVWPSDLFLRLLVHNLPIVAPLVYLRRHPFPPSLFHADEDGNYRVYQWQELAGKTGLLPVDTCGGPLAVIRREVLDAIGDPWFQCQPGHLVYPHEDLYFFNRARLAGFQPYVDLDLAIGHCFPAYATPQRLGDGSYGVRLTGYEDLGIVQVTDAEVTTATTHHAYT